MYKEISVGDLANWQASSKEFVLLDVREADEIASAAIAGSLNIPMREIPTRVGELEKTTTIAVLCHHGGRSVRVAQFLAAQGFADVHNVEGGIDAYAATIDPSLARY